MLLFNSQTGKVVKATPAQATAIAKAPPAQAAAIVNKLPEEKGPAVAQPPKMPDPRQSYLQDFTVYEIDFTAAALVAGATLNSAVFIQADSMFVWQKATFYADIGGAVFTDSTRPIPQVSVSITDQGSQRQLFTAPVPIQNIFGNGQLPFILPVERVFDARTTIAVQVVNFSTATAYNLKLSLIGKKIFKYSK